MVLAFYSEEEEKERGAASSEQVWDSPISPNALGSKRPKVGESVPQLGHSLKWTWGGRKEGTRQDVLFPPPPPSQLSLTQRTEGILVVSHVGSRK